MAKPTVLGSDVIANPTSVTTTSKVVAIPAGTTHALVFWDKQLDGGSPTTYTVTLGTDSGSALHTPIDSFGWTTHTYGIVVTVSGNQTLAAAVNTGTVGGPVHIVFLSGVDAADPWEAPVTFGEEADTLTVSAAVDPTTADQIVVGHACFWGNNGLTPAETLAPGAGQTELQQTQIDATSGASWDTVASTSVEDGTGAEVTHSYAITENTAWATAIRHLVAVRVNGQTGADEAVADTGAGTDAPGVALAVPASDAAAATDVPAPALAAPVTDAAAGTDAVTADLQTGGSSETVADTAPGTDVVVPAVGAGSADTGSASDAAAPTAGLAAAETALGTDAVAADLTLPTFIDRSVVDAAAGADVASATPGAFAADLAAAVDALLASLASGAADSGAGLDAVSYDLTTPTTAEAGVADAGAASDTVGFDLGLAAGVADAGVATDLVAQAAGLLVLLTETGTWSDLAYISRPSVVRRALVRLLQGATTRVVLVRGAATTVRLVEADE